LFQISSKNGLLKTHNYINLKQICYSVSERHHIWLAGRQEDYLINQESNLNKNIKKVTEIILDKKNNSSTDLKTNFFLKLCSLNLQKKTFLHFCY
jgi:hypothetical protein